MAQLEELTRAVADLDEPRALQLVDEFVASNPSQAALLDAIKASQDGMVEVGQRFETKDYFVAELIFGAELLKQVMSRVKPHLQVSTDKIGRVVIGTVRGDIHDIGKDIVIDLLGGAGFEVYDLGKDVPPQRFVDKVREVNAQIVGMSGLLTLAIDSMKQTVAALEAAGLRSEVKVIIGGNPVDERVRDYVGADRFTRSAAEGVAICKQWVEA